MAPRHRVPSPEPGWWLDVAWLVAAVMFGAVCGVVVVWVW